MSSKVISGRRLPRLRKSIVYSLPMNNPTPSEKRIILDKDTELPFTGELLDENRVGVS